MAIDNELSPSAMDKYISRVYTGLAGAICLAGLSTIFGENGWWIWVGGLAGFALGFWLRFHNEKYNGNPEISVAKS